MKKSMVAVMLTVFTTIGVYGDESVTKAEGNRIRFSFADKEIIVLLIDNSAVRSLIAMLPLTLEFQDYAGSEKISYLTKKLDTSDTPAGYTPSSGDLMLYAPWGNLAFFYRDGGYAAGLVPLGKIVSGAASLGRLGGGVSVHVDKVQ
ncbi:MAG TPA: cyclophilin-like fold protein [Spirochaetia bacterium]|nr:cyclophilin-like fold protein [Spirochaetia bacterium]